MGVLPIVITDRQTIKLGSTHVSIELQKYTSPGSANMRYPHCALDLGIGCLRLYWLEDEGVYIIIIPVNSIMRKGISLTSYP